MPDCTIVYVLLPHEARSHAILSRYYVLPEGASVARWARVVATNLMRAAYEVAAVAVVIHA